MRLLSRLRKNRHGKRGFTLIECIVSIAIFVIMSTMFATFLMNSVRVVNLSIANDRDREALMEAIAAADPTIANKYVDMTGNEVTIEAKSLEDGKKLKLCIRFDEGKTEVPDLNNIPAPDPATDVVKDTMLDGDYFVFTAENGAQYMVYLPKDPTMVPSVTDVGGDMP